MANTSRIFGFRLAGRVGGGMVTINKYFVPSTDGTALYPGDPVKLAGSADTAGNYATVTLAAAGDPIVGVVVGFMPDPTDLNITGQDRAASTNRYVFVCDDPEAIYEVETSNGTPAAADVGLNVNHAVGSPSATTATSGATIDMGTKATTATLTFKILKFVPRPDNEVAASAKMYVKVNSHTMGWGTGTAGV